MRAAFSCAQETAAVCARKTIDNLQIEGIESLPACVSELCWVIVWRQLVALQSVLPVHRVVRKCVAQLTHWCCPQAAEWHACGRIDRYG